MVVILQSSRVPAKWLYSGKVVVFGQRFLYSGKSGCIRAKVVVVGQNWLYSEKICCIRDKIFVFLQKGSIWAKPVVFGQKLWYLGKLLYSVKVVVIKQK